MKNKSSFKWKGLLFIYMWIVTLGVFAQNITVTGTVTDESGMTVIGATVIVSGDATRGSITDTDGKYTLANVQSDGILVFSYVGMQSQSVRVNGRTTVNVVMLSDSELLEEVVVVGYGSQKKVNLTGAVSSIDIGKVAESRPITNLSAGLAGLAPGLYVRSSNNDPGSNAALMIRGQGTLNNSSPLVIIDGVEGDISRVSPRILKTSPY